MSLKIEMYTKTYCPYCVRAKELFKLKGIENIMEYNIEENPEKRDEMVSRRPGARTVPQIFINDKAIGGCDDLYALEKDHKLDELLK
jgi:glutaredoxin 3